jgi:hypothetical protein
LQLVAPKLVLVAASNYTLAVTIDIYTYHLFQHLLRAA